MKHLEYRIMIADGVERRFDIESLLFGDKDDRDEIKALISMGFGVDMKFPVSDDNPFNPFPKHCFHYHPDGDYGKTRLEVNFKDAGTHNNS